SQILPREFVEKFPEKIILEGFIGTGPFMPTEYKNQVIASYKRNPDYFKKDSAGNQLPYLDEISYLYFADPQSQHAAFRAHQVDVDHTVQKTDIDNIMKAEPNAKAYVVPGLTIYNYRFNMKFKPFQDVKV